jgi:septal ring factor EnvC (AmiA/AmiB activator)
MLQLIALGCPMTQDEPSLAAAPDGTRQEDQKPVRRTRGVLVFLVVMAVIGVSSGLAWRIFTNYTTAPAVSQRAAERDNQTVDVQKLKDAVDQLERSQRDLLQRVEALQATQERVERSLQVDIQRLSQQISTLDGELRKYTAAPPAAPRAPPPATKNQKRSPSLAPAPAGQANQPGSNPSPVGRPPPDGPR